MEPNAEEEEKVVDDSLVKIGDIIYIMHKLSPSQKAAAPTRVCIIADSYMRTEVLSVKEDSCKTLVELSLFRIESVCTITEGDPKQAKRAQKVEQERNSGRDLHYGDIIQLRHLASGKILAISSTEAAKTAGSWKVVLQDVVDCNCWLRLMPSELVRDEGHSIKYTDQMMLAFRAERLYFYLNLKQLPESEDFEVNAFQVPYTWRITKFQDHSEHRVRSVKFGSVVRLRHKETKQHLCANASKGQLHWLKLLKDTVAKRHFEGESKELLAMIEEISESKQEPLFLSRNEYYYDGLWVVENTASRMMGGPYCINKPLLLRSAITGEYLSHSMDFNEVPNVENNFHFKSLNEVREDTPMMFGTATVLGILDLPRRFVSFNYLEPKDNLLSRLTVTNDPRVYADTLVHLEHDERNFNQGLFEVLEVPKKDADFVLQVANFIKFLKKFPNIISASKKVDKKFISSLKRAYANEDKTRDAYESLVKGYDSINNRLKNASHDDFISLQMALLRLNFPVITIALCCKISDLNKTMVVTFGKHFMGGLSVDNSYSENIERAFAAMIENLNLSSRSNFEISSIVSRLHSEVYPLIRVHPDAVGSLLSMIYHITDIKLADPSQSLRIWFDRLETVSKDNVKRQTYLLKIIHNMIQVDNTALLNYQMIFLNFMYHDSHPFDIIKLARFEDQFFGVSLTLGGKSIEQFLIQNELHMEDCMHLKEGRKETLYINFKELCRRPEYEKYIAAALKLYSCLLEHNPDAINELAGINHFDIDMMRDLAMRSEVGLVVKTQLISLSSILILSRLGMTSFTENINKNFCFTEENLRYEPLAFYKTFFPQNDRDKEWIDSIATWITKFWLTNENSDLDEPEIFSISERDNEMPTLNQEDKLQRKLDHLLTVMKITYELVDRQMCGKMFLEVLSRIFVYFPIGLSGKCESFKDRHWLVRLMIEATVKQKEDKQTRMQMHYKLSKAIQELGRLYRLLLDIKNYRRAKNYLILFNHYRSHFTKLNMRKLRNRLPYEFEGEAIKIDQLYRRVNPIMLGGLVVPGDVSAILTRLVTTLIPAIDVQDEHIEMHSFYILELVLSDLDIPQKLATQLISVHTELLDDSADLIKRLNSTQLILQDRLIQLKVKLDKIDKYFGTKRLKSRLIRGLVKPDEMTKEGVRCFEYVVEFEKKLRKLLNLVQQRKNEKFYVKTAQNICRLNGLYLKLLEIWQLLNETQLNTELHSSGFRLTNFITSCLMYIVLDNPKNQSKLKKLLDPKIFDIRLPKLPAIIKETNSTSKLKPEAFKTIMTELFNQYRVEDRVEFKALLNWLSVILFNEDDSANQQIQNIVSNMLIEKITLMELNLYNIICNGEAKTPLSNDPELVAAVYQLLAFCAVDNPIVVYQCRKLIKAEEIKSCLEKLELSSDLVATLFTLFTNIYLANIPGVESSKAIIVTVGEILQIANNIIRAAVDDKLNLNESGRTGKLCYVVNTDNPALYDINLIESHEQKDNAAIWRCLYDGDLWENKSGLLFFIQAAMVLALEKKDLSLQDTVKETLHEIIILRNEVNQISFQNSKLDLTILVKCIERTHRNLTKYIEACKGNDLPDAEKPEADELEDKDENLECFINYMKESNLIKKSKSLIFQISQQILTMPVISIVFDEDVSDEDVNACAYRLIKMKTICSNQKSRQEFFTIMEALLHYQKPKPKPKDKKEKIEKKKEDDRREEEEDKQPERPPTYFTRVLVEAGILEEIMSAITESDSLKERNSALRLLLTVLGKRADKIQNDYLSVLKEKDRAFALFMVIKAELDESRKRIANYQSSRLKQWNLARLQYSRENKEIKAKVNYQKKYARMLLQLLQAACDNCHKDSQIFMQTQENKQGRTINMVEAIANFFIEIVAQYHADDDEALEMLSESIQAMIEFATGPCEENQRLLVNNVQLFQAINLLMQNIFDMILEKKGLSDDLKQKYITIYQKLTKLIHTFLEGASREDNAKILINNLNMAYLKQHVETIYTSFIETRSKSVKHEIMPDPNESKKTRRKKSEKQRQMEISPLDFEVINTGVSLAIVLTLLRKASPNHPILSQCKSEAEIDSKQLAIKLFKKKVVIDTVQCYDFYNSYIGCVEVQFNGTIEEVYFPIPFKCKFLSSKTKYEIIYNVSRSSQQEKIEDFLQKVEVAKAEMSAQQLLSRKTAVKAISSKWTSYYLMSYILILAINLLMIATIKDKDELDLDSNDSVSASQLAMTVLGALQLFFTVLGFSCYIVEYKEKIIKAGNQRDVDFEIENYYGIQHNDSILMEPLYVKLTDTKTKGFVRKFTHLLFHTETLYHVFIFLPLSFFSLFFPILYPWLLLDIVKRSESIRNIVKSIVLNLFQLAMTGFLGLIVIYIFSVIGFMYFGDCYDNCDDYDDPTNTDPNFSPCGQRVSQFNAYCDTLFDCFISTLYLGIRMGGGIGEAIKSPVKNDSKCDYWSRMAFDLLFFVFIILILLNIIFGIIIDTYADLRVQRLKIKDDVNNCCYICGGKKNDLEQDSKGWSEHFMNRHSVYAYLAFIVYISEKKEEDCNGLEKFVKAEINAKKVSFFPIRESNDEDEDD